MPILFSVGKKVKIGIAKSARLSADVVHAVNCCIAHRVGLPSIEPCVIVHQYIALIPQSQL